MKKLLIALGFILTATASFAATQISNVVVKSSIASVQLMGLGAAQYPDVQTTSYYSGLNKGGAFYHWDTSSTTNDCAHIAVTGITTGRYVLRADLQDGYILPTQCGAYFDGSADGGSGHDDSAAWQAAFDMAYTYGYVVGPVAGTTRIISTINPHYGTIFNGAGMGVEILQFWSNVSGQGFYLQAPVGTTVYQGPQFSNFSIVGNLGTNLIQINCSSSSAPCGFTDDASTQGYIDSVIIDHVGANVPTFQEENIAFQLNKCFHCVVRYSSVSIANTHGIDIEGSDFAVVERNRVLGANNSAGSNHAIHVAQRGTFGNFDVIDHNDVLRTRGASDAYIYSSARSAKITFNGIEDGFGDPAVTCNIKIENGFSTEASDNLLQAYLNAGDTYGFCINGDFWYTLDIHGNSLFSQGFVSNVNNGSGLRSFVTGSAPIIRQSLVHYGNNTEVGFPFSMSGSGTPATGNLLYDATPNTYVGIDGTNYGATVRVTSNGLLDNQSPAWILPPIASLGSLITFVNPAYPLTGTMSLCFKAITGAPSTTIHAQIDDNGVSTATASVTLSVSSGTLLQCPSALQHIAISTKATFLFWNDDTTHNGNDYLSEVFVTPG